MIVLVAGGTGFLGRKVVELLEKDGHKVIVHHRGHRAVPTNADVIVNCVGIIRETLNQTFKEAHVDKTRWLVKLARKLKAKQFVLVSAIGADRGTTEYWRTKRKAEKIVEKSGLNYCVIRPSMLAGPGGATERFRSISRTGFFPLFGNGNVQPVHRDTVAELVVAAAHRRVRNRIVEVGGPEIMTYGQLAKRLHPGVVIVRLPGWLVSALSSIGNLVPLLPTKEMVRMLREDNTTTDKTVWTLGIGNPTVR